MKRIVVLLLMLTLLYSTTACNAPSPSPSPPSVTPSHIGTWYLDLGASLADEGEEGEIYLTLKSDNTSVWEEIADEWTDSWSSLYILVDTADDLQDEGYDDFYCCYAPNSDSLIVRIDGYNLTFQRVK